MMASDGVWHITPAYDFTFSVDTSAPGYITRHCLTINNKYADIERADLLQIAKRYNIKGAESIVNKAVDVVSNYAHYAQLANVDEHWTNKISEEINCRIEGIKVL